MKVGMKFSKIGFFDVIQKFLDFRLPQKMKVLKSQPDLPTIKKNNYQNKSDPNSLKSGRRTFNIIEHTYMTTAKTNSTEAKRSIYEVIFFLPNTAPGGYPTVFLGSKSKHA